MLFKPMNESEPQIMIPSYVKTGLFCNPSCQCTKKLNKEHGWDIPLHVDAASGGFVAPFVQPDLVWDFVLPGQYICPSSSLLLLHESYNRHLTVRV